MEGELYDEIIAVIDCFQYFSRDAFKTLAVKFPNIKIDTLWSIVFLHYQKRMKQCHIKSKQVAEKYYHQYKTALEKNEEPGIIVRISRKNDITPCLAARLILSEYIEENKLKSDSESNTNNVKRYIRNTDLIPDPILAYETYLCTLYDHLYSPTIDFMKKSLGLEYESLLYSKLTKLNVPYRDEEYMRKYGYDKTPDVKFEVPVIVDGFVINWIESKALFGNVQVHAEYMENQYLSYLNRFGTGLILYWFGYNKNILSQSEKRFLIKDHLPMNMKQYFDVLHNVEISAE